MLLDLLLSCWFFLSFFFFFNVVTKSLYLQQLLKHMSGFGGWGVLMSVFITVMGKISSSGPSANRYCTLRDCIFYISSVYFCSDSQCILSRSPLNRQDIKWSQSLPEKLLLLCIHKTKNGQHMSNFREKHLSGLKAKSCIWILQATSNKNDDTACWDILLCHGGAWKHDSKYL